MDIYKDRNAYVTANAYKRTPRPAHRNWLGHVDATVEEQNRYESTLGAHGRSGDQWGRVGIGLFTRRVPTAIRGASGIGKPARVDPVTAAYWREHYDLSEHPAPELADARPETPRKAQDLCGGHGQLLPQQRGLRCRGVPEERRPAGRMRWWTMATAPSIAGIGDHTRANAYSRLRYPQMVLPWVVERILDTAPAGADVDSWRY